MATAFATLTAMVLATMFATPTGIASAGDASRDPPAAREAQTEPTRTVKERLDSKASDEQRVDNCKVPLDLRGPKPRPDDCNHGASTAPQR